MSLRGTYRGTIRISAIFWSQWQVLHPSCCTSTSEIRDERLPGRISSIGTWAEDWWEHVCDLQERVISHFKGLRGSQPLSEVLLCHFPHRLTVWRWWTNSLSRSSWSPGLTALKEWATCGLTSAAWTRLRGIWKLLTMSWVWSRPIEQRWSTPPRVTGEFYRNVLLLHILF